MNLCIYCGKKNGDSRDHVPPKSILIKPYPNNLITVPCFKECNSGFGSQSDEQLKLYLAKLIATAPPTDCRKKFLESAKKTLDNNNEASNKLKKSIIGNINYGKNLLTIIPK